MYYGNIRLNSKFIKYFRLTKLQQDLIKALVVFGPASSSRLARFVRRHYESVWRSLKYMEGKGLIRVTAIKRGSTNRPKKTYEITGMAFQGLLNIDLDIAWQMGSWIYTLREISRDKLVEALVYLPQDDKLHRVIVPLKDEYMELARKTALSMHVE